MIQVEQKQSPQSLSLIRALRDARTLRRIALFWLTVFWTALVQTAWAACATPGNDGPGTITGVSNAYYPGVGTAFSGGTSLSIGAADSRVVNGSQTGQSNSINPGDLLLIIQMQDASISTANTASYGGSGTGAGYTSLGSSGLYEYAIAANAVGTLGGTLQVTAPLLNTYNSAAATGTRGQHSYQVIRVPQYSSLTLSGTITPPPWNGATGGVLAVDVAGNLNWGGATVDVSGRGFRGGGAQCSNTNGTGQTMANTDYRSAIGTGAVNLAGVGNVPNGTKGEGVAGTPILVFNPTVINDNSNGTVTTTPGTDGSTGGYPLGSFARGAPGNGGGGGTDGNPAANDQNSGGGGGGNYVAGGLGGFGWTPGTPPGSQTGGYGGAAVPSAAARLFMGGGGGSATSNNCTGTPGNAVASSGAAGGGIVMIRAGTTSNAGTINANGTSANTTVGNDASGGGGAGGSVLLFVNNSGAATGAAVNIRGGNGGNNAPGTGPNCPHGPGGGGATRKVNCALRRKGKTRGQGIAQYRLGCSPLAHLIG
jgi:hypothetical protein